MTKKPYYTEGEENYAHIVWARSREDAAAKCEKRGIGEEVMGVCSSPPDRHIYTEELSDEKFLDNLPEILHQTIYLARLAFNSGTVQPDELLAEDGVLHELIHYLHHPDLTEDPISHFHQTRVKLKELQRSVPGFHPEGT